MKTLWLFWLLNNRNNQICKPTSDPNIRFYSSFAARKRQIGRYFYSLISSWFIDPPPLHPTGSISTFWSGVGVQIDSIPEMIRQVGLLAGSFMLLLLRNVSAQGESLAPPLQLCPKLNFESIRIINCCYSSLHLNSSVELRQINLNSWETLL